MTSGEDVVDGLWFLHVAVQADVIAVLSDPEAVFSEFLAVVRSELSVQHSHASWPLFLDV